MKLVCWGAAIAASVALSVCATSRAAVIPASEDVMASPFFTGADLVRGYPGDNRPTLRVSTNNAFGLTGAETIYLKFAPAQFAGIVAPVPQVLLSVESISGGFGADVGPAAPFAVSAHAVSADPIASITDNTNPGGPISWSAFFTNNVLPAAPAATTVVNSFGTVQFDVTSIVNDWISGANTTFAIALTGKNHGLNAIEFLAGFKNNTEAPGSTFITTVPEPTSALLMVAAVGLVGCCSRRLRNSQS